MTYHEKTTHVAKGRWRGILLTLGLPESCLRDRHGPCPLCGGKDRFRWDNRDGSGSYICGQCGAGDGMKLAMEYTGKPFPEIAREIDAMVGNIRAEAPKPAMSDDDRRNILRDTYKATVPVEPGDLVHRYLAARGVDEVIYPPALRFGAALRDGEGGIRPCMVAMVTGPDGKPVTMHRTFLRPDGSDKAEMAAPRKLMPGDVPDGSCIRLSDYVAGGPLGVAEGIETALAACAIFQMPVWATINTALMRRWHPPEGCTEVAIFADNDPAYGGQCAAYALAHRLATGKAPITVTVHIPKQVGTDWNDVYTKGLPL